MPDIGAASAAPIGVRAHAARIVALPRHARCAHRTGVPARAPDGLPAVPAADPLPAVLDAIYDAALDPARWPDALAALAAGLRGNAATLHAGPAGAPPSVAAAFGVGEAALRAYQTRYGVLDPIANAAAQGAGRAAPVTAREAAGDGLERTEFFAGWMRPNGFGDALCLELPPPGAAHHAGIRVYRPPHARRFGPGEAAVLARLAPHLRRAAEVQRRLFAAAAGVPPAEPFAEALDRLAAGVALLDGGGALVWANRAADRLLRAGDGLSLDRGGALRASSSAATEALRRLVRAAAAGAEGAMQAPRPSGRAALALQAAPLPARASAAAEREPVPPTAAGAPRRPSVLLLLSDPAERAAPDAALQRRLRAIYGLTAAEAAVAARAAHGVGLPEVAESLGLGVATARTHAQRVFSKAGVRGQAELARRVERLSLLRAEHAEHATPAG